MKANMYPATLASPSNGLLNHSTTKTNNVSDITLNINV